LQGGSRKRRGGCARKGLRWKTRAARALIGAMNPSLSPEMLSLIGEKIGGAPESWTIDEIGDGNVNLIFHMSGPRGQVLIKQAVPYLRCVGESWPLSVKRCFFEYTALKEHARVAASYLPEVYAYDEKSSAMAMEFLSDHLIMRKGVMKGVRYPAFSEHISEYMARTLFFTSDLHLPAAVKKEKMKIFSENTDLCKITEDLIFTDPYRTAKQNRWTSPQLDPIAREFHADSPLKLAITGMKAKFLTSAQALIHGDLHTGSIMVNERETKVIDPEFAFYGPMGFDVGLLFANLLLGYFSQAGLGSHPDERRDYEDWLISQITEVWQKFSSKFSRLWEDELKGDYLSPGIAVGDGGHELFNQLRADYIQAVWDDSIRFAGAEMIRRTFGLAHVADMDSIGDPDQRALCETRNLRMARELLVEYARYPGPAELTALARRLRNLKGTA
jgi:5-methylthioribose kinase